MVSNHRFYARRASEEMARAARALTSEAREWHQQLAESFTKRAQERTAAGGR
jgi:hypothetical protein